MESSGGGGTARSLVAGVGLTDGVPGDLVKHCTPDVLDAAELPPVGAGREPLGNIYEIARSLVDELRAEVVAEFELASHPDFSAGLEAFCFSLLHNVATREVHLAEHVAAESTRYEEIVLWNSTITDTFQRAFGFSDRCALRHAYPDQRRSMRKIIHDLAERGQDSERVAEQVTGLPLIAIGGPADVTVGARYLRALGEFSECNVLLKGAVENLLPQLEAACPRLAIRRIYRLDALSPRPKVLRRIAIAFRDAYRATAELGLGRLTLLVPRLVESLLTCDGLKRLVDDLEPSMVFGTLERSPVGIMLTWGGRESRTCPIISYQHGLLPLTGTMELFDFDLLILWDDSWRRTVVRDGYPSPDSIVTCPPWDKAPRLGPRVFGRSSATWRPSGTCVAYVEQPLKKSPYSLSDHLGMLDTLSCLGSRYGFSVLVKPHPATYDDPMYRIPDSLKNVIRVGANVTLEDVARESEFAIGLNSTALLDFEIWGKPCISVDYRGWSEMVGLPDGLFTHRVADDSELEQVLARLAGRAGWIGRLRALFLLGGVIERWRRDRSARRDGCAIEAAAQRLGVAPTRGNAAGRPVAP